MTAEEAMGNPHDAGQAWIKRLWASVAPRWVTDAAAWPRAVYDINSATLRTLADVAHELREGDTVYVWKEGGGDGRRPGRLLAVRWGKARRRRRKSCGY